MKQVTLIALLLFVTASTLAQRQIAQSVKPIWAKAATALKSNCVVASKSQVFRSPDGRTLAELRCRAQSGDADPILYLRLVYPGGETREVELQEGAQELLWAPDSKAFFVNGGQSAYSGFFSTVYRTTGEGIQTLHVTQFAQRDMVTSFPPCKAFKRDRTDCKNIEANPEFNMSGLSWANGSSAIIVMAEVPCSSSYGGIMCQVLGYKLDALDGRILQRMTARELKRQWQNSMTWGLRIPDPPTYGSPLQ